MGSKSNSTPIIFIVGETASGKTAAGIKVAQKVGGEIICADSRTVYKQMDIGTAKPTKKEQGLVPHHLIDIVEPGQSFSAAEFKCRAEKCIQEIIGRGNVPIVVGGTGLYIDALLYNFQFKDKPNTTLRNKLLQMNDEELTTLLNTKSIDTSNLNTKNRRHIIRAIERDGKVPNDSVARESSVILGLSLERAILRTRIEDRVELMFAEGFLEEVEHLAATYGWDNEAMSGIGYRVARDYFENNATEDEVKAAFITRDMSLAKRQRTWFKRNPSIQWFKKPDLLIEKAVEFAESFHYNETNV